MVQWSRLLTFGRENYRDEARRLLPTHRDGGVSSAIPAAEVTKVALRLKYLIEQVVPCELEEWKITRANSAVITQAVEKAALEAGVDEQRNCVIYCLLICKRWFKRQSILELWDAQLHNTRAVACEVVAKHLIEAEEDQQYLMEEVLLKRYSIIRNGQESVPTNVIETAVDLHALRVIGSSGYQKCISHLWRGWMVQDDEDASKFVEWKQKANTSYWAHFDPDRMRAPVYQNAVQIFFSLFYLGLFTGAINTINPKGDLDLVEGLLYLFTFAFTCDEGAKLWKVGWFYIGFWNIFNLTLYMLLTVSFITRMIAFSHPGDGTDENTRRKHFNELSYNFLAFSAPMFWLRLLLFLDSFRFLGSMLVVLKVMMKESLIFFALLGVIIIGFLQAFIGMDNVDDNATATHFILQAMANTVMQSPDFTGFENFAPPFGIILYYIFTFVVMVVLLNILIALYNSAYQDITDNAIDEYMALFSQKTMQFVRAPDENVFIAPFNLIEMFFLILPFEWWMPKPLYSRINDLVMLAIYSPLLLVTSFIETNQAHKVRHNRHRGEEDDDTVEEWEQMTAEIDFENEGWAKKVKSVVPNVKTDTAVLEVRSLAEKVEELKRIVETIKRDIGQKDSY